MKSVLKYFFFLFITGFALTASAQDTLFYDDFENQTLTNWEITNDGGDCVWLPVELNARSYTLPPGAMGWGMTADSDSCGAETTILSTATMVNPLNMSEYSNIWIEFDNDWRILDSGDEAYVEVSADSGNTWTTIVSWLGVEQRATHEVWDVSSYAAAQPDVRFRFRVIQPGWDWWWAIDNFAVYTDTAVVSVEDNPSTLPGELYLFQNYPNPFNPTTKIRFSIPNIVSNFSLSTTLVVYDVLGNEVVTLVNEEKAPGIYEVEFDATKITSGIYFYKLTAGEYTATRKMIVLK